MRASDPVSITDKRTSNTDEVDPAGINVGAIVAYPDENGEVRRGVVIHQTPQTTQILDGDHIIRLRNERRAQIKMLARSTEAYAQRAALEAAALRVAHGWCSVPTNMIRNVNTTPIKQAPLLVIARAEQTFYLNPTPITARRKVALSDVLKSSFVPNDIGYWSSRDFTFDDQLSVQMRRKYSLELVDELP